MEVGPFRTVSASKSASGQVDLELVEGGWEEFATIVFSQSYHFRASGPSLGGWVLELTDVVDQPPGTGFSYVPTNGYLSDLTQVCTVHIGRKRRVMYGRRTGSEL